MRSINYETKNSVATFSLRSRCIRKPSSSVVSSVAFLTGMAAVVLGAMFAFSLPSFAAPPIRIILPGTGDIEIANEDVIHGNDTSIHADHAGTGNIGITNEFLVDADDTGIRAEHTGRGNIGITNEWSTVGRDTGIRAEHNGTGDIGINNEWNVDGLDTAIHADHEGEGNIGIINEHSV